MQALRVTKTVSLQPRPSLLDASLSEAPSLAMPRHPIQQLVTLRALPQRPPALQPRRALGPLKILQSNRSPVQLSLFERPSAGR